MTAPQARSRSAGGESTALQELFRQRSGPLFRIANLLTGDERRAADLVVVLFRRLAQMPNVGPDLSLVQLVRSMWVIVSRGTPVAYDSHHVLALAASGDLSLAEISAICELPRAEVAAMLRRGLASEFDRLSSSESPVPP